MLDRAKQTITKEDLMFGTGKKKIVNINDDDDFPDLDDSEPFQEYSIPASRKVGMVVQKIAPKKTKIDDDWESKALEQKILGGVNVQLAQNKARPQTSKP